MEYETERYTTYCRRIQEFVNHEITVIHDSDNPKFIATCTGIDSDCFDCLLIRLNDVSLKELERNLPGIKYYQQVKGMNNQVKKG